MLQTQNAIAALTHSGEVVPAKTPGANMRIIEGDPFNNDLIEAQRKGYQEEQRLVQEAKRRNDSFINRLTGGFRQASEQQAAPAQEAINGN